MGGEDERDGLTRFGLPRPLSDEPRNAALAPGKLVGDFRLLAMIGQGGMAQVWEAEQLSLGGRRVAVKFVRPDQVTDRRLEFFAREARAGGRLHHRGIVTVHGYGTTDELSWLAMELVEGGRTLKDFLNEAQQAPQVAADHDREVARLLAEVAEAMQTAHDAGVVHRDLKPQNVLLPRDGHPKVTDFGLARITDETALSETGDLVGTYAYMSPEQVTARRAGLDHRTDVFSLGIVLYELLTLRRPFEGDTSHQIAAQILLKEPPDPRAVRSRVPRDLAVIVGKALEKERERRFQTMALFAADLRRVLADEPIQARPPTRLDRAVKWVKRNPTRSTAAGIVVLAFGVVSALLVQNVRTNRALKRKTAEAEASAKAAHDSAEEATRGRDEVLRLSALQTLDDLAAKADRLWPARPENLPAYEAWLEEWRGLLDERPAHEKKLAELRAKALPPTGAEHPVSGNHPREPDLERARGELAYLRRMRDRTAPRPDESDPTLADVGVDPASLPNSAGEVCAMAWALVDPDRERLGDEPKGLALARRALELGAGVSASERAVLQDALAWALFANGRFDDAIAQAEEAVEAAPDARKDEYGGYLERLTARIDEELDPGRDAARTARVAELEQRITALETKIGERTDWRFADPQDRWWHDQLAKLIAGLEAFADPGTGLASGGLDPQHGWGIARRVEFASTIAERSVSGPEAAARWVEAIASVGNRAECPRYDGLHLSPQVGLLPVGRDPDSGLWEFAHLQSGAPPRRSPTGRLQLDGATSLVFVLLPGGTFSMGAQKSDPGGENYDPDAATDEAPLRAVTLSPFLLSKYEMTQGQWKAFTGSNPSFYAPGRGSAVTKVSLRHPVEQVPWLDCVEELGRLGLVLPSEAQWEYACRAGTTTPWSTGATLESLRGTANVADEGSAYTFQAGWTFEPGFADGWDVHCPVGTLRPNAFGLHEMHGNVWEWCQDAYQERYDASTLDPVFDAVDVRFRVFRGGSWNDRVAVTRSANRIKVTPEVADRTLGLRPAMVLVR